MKIEIPLYTREYEYNLCDCVIIPSRGIFSDFNAMLSGIDEDKEYY